jgi:cytoskeletal protein CcmA (bactofilin family)
MHTPHKSTSEKSSILGPTLRFKGELSSEEDLVIHGQIEGTVGPAPTVTIGPEAQIKAGVTADVIVVEGQVDGDLTARVSIAVRDKANVRGNLAAPVIIVAEGALVNGSLRMEPGRKETDLRPADSGNAAFARTGTDE